MPNPSASVNIHIACAKSGKLFQMVSNNVSVFAWGLSSKQLHRIATLMNCILKLFLPGSRSICPACENNTLNIDRPILVCVDSKGIDRDNK